jgi:hypothetical protein
MSIFDKVFIFFAQTKISTGSGGVNIPTRTAAQVLEDSLNLVYFVAGITAVIAIIIAGYTFTTAVYDPVKITQAKNTILYAVIGLIVVVIAFFITQFVMKNL